jgi:hypothetical protein
MSVRLYLDIAPLLPSGLHRLILMKNPFLGAATVILARKVRRLRKKTGDMRYRSRSEEGASIWSVVLASMTRHLCILS